MAPVVAQQIPQASFFGLQSVDESPLLQSKLAGSNQILKPRYLTAPLNYIKVMGDGSDDFISYTDKPETQKKPVDSRMVTIHDVTGQEDQFTLDKNGFQFFSHMSTEKEFDDEGRIKEFYYPETEQLLKDILGASRVVGAQHVVRRQGTNQAGPVHKVHFDSSIPYARSLVEEYFPDDAEVLLKGHVQQMNVWRPIKQVLRNHLAVAHAHSIPATDEVPITIISPDPKQKNGCTNEVRYGPTHKWFYKPGMKPDEVLIFKTYDSKTDGRARRVAHAAFEDPDAEEGLPGRESIELRAFVFYDDNSG